MAEATQPCSRLCNRPQRLLHRGGGLDPPERDLLFLHAEAEAVANDPVSESIPISSHAGVAASVAAHISLPSLHELTDWRRALASRRWSPCVFPKRHSALTLSSSAWNSSSASS